jgi:hypothetical protein
MPPAAWESGWGVKLRTKWGRNTGTAALRAALQEKGIVSAEEKRVERLNSLDLSEAQKRDELAYRPGLVIEPHFHVPGAQTSEQLFTYGYVITSNAAQSKMVTGPFPPCRCTAYPWRRGSCSTARARSIGSVGISCELTPNGP